MYTYTHTVTPLNMNKFPSKNMFVQLVHKSNKVSLGTQLIIGYIVLYCNKVYNTFHTNNT